MSRPANLKASDLMPIGECAKRFGAAMLACAFAVGCSPPPPDGPQTAAEILDENVRPTAADKRAAAFLSLGNNSSLQSITDPYQRALSCIIALEWLDERMRSGSMATPEQRRGLAQVGEIYANEGLDTGKSRTDLARDLERARAEGIEEREQARLAMSCLRRFT